MLLASISSAKFFVWRFRWGKGRKRVAMPRAVHRFLLQRTSVTRREAPPCGKHYPPFDSQRRQGDSGGRHTRSTAMVDTELVIMFTQRTNVQRRWWCCLSTMQRLRWEGWWLSSGCATQVYDSLILFTPGGNILDVDTSLYDVLICKKKTVFKDMCVMCVWEREIEKQTETSGLGMKTKL